MRFLVDECTGPSVAEWLRNQKHEVFSVFEEARGMDIDCQTHLSLSRKSRFVLPEDRLKGDIPSSQFIRPEKP